MKQIMCKNLSIGYSNNVLHKDINLSINKGSYVCIVGDNGAGKSTFIKTFLGLINPISGSVEMSNGLKPSDIGYLPQQTQVQKDFPASVYEVVLSGCLNKLGFRMFYNNAEKQLAKDMLEKLGITHLMKKSYSTLSGGQQQRVLLARALCATNKILLLDEPSAGLDAGTTREFYHLIKDLNDEGITIMMITHHIQDAIEYSNYILSVNKTGVEYMTTEKFKEMNI